MKVQQYQQGQPCWIELATHDWAAGKAFYQALFGWGADDMPMPEGHYTMLQIDGDDIAAMYPMPAEMEALPTHWTIYFAVDDVDATSKVVTQAGGEIIAGPHSVGDAGRMALCTDPEGCRFALWQGQDHIGIKRSQESNTLCWVELACRDTAAAKQFYSQVLGYQTQLNDVADFEYTEWYADEQAIGGMMEMTAEWGDTLAHWMSYFAVDDCDVSVTKAQTLGATVCVPATNIPNVGRFSVLNDPQGGVFSIIALFAAE
ncbi:VOC family protein [Shewanella sp. BF02_Schw]|jgi:predicted enzyme related to lactoylglutathione lyase|uniref:VOC family protein n=1 Tax=Shewanella sp. BF02_Schw TaxID=394908 RepID=UPI00177F9E7A|nr:VOC family protein [Shewanella sp. BF02_Schw]MBO1897183.1 VOC family protein [Shewanella sp. BF02_Schw]